MGNRDSPSVLQVLDREAADALTNPNTLKHLAPFLGKACSVSQAARETSSKPNTVLKRVQVFLDLGLLEVVEVVARHGRGIKLYRTTADSYFIPFHITSAETLESALAEKDAYWERLLRKNVVRTRLEAVGTWGTRIYRDARDRLQVQMAVTPDKNATTLDPGGPAVVSAWRDSLYLDFDEAKLLQRELFELIKRYQRKRGAQRYVLRLGLAPLEPFAD
jgi:predicted AAA+ superfamily ATPase